MKSTSTKLTSIDGLDEDSRIYSLGWLLRDGSEAD